MTDSEVISGVISGIDLPALGQDKGRNSAAEASAPSLPAWFLAVSHHPTAVLPLLPRKAYTGLRLGDLHTCGFPYGHGSFRINLAF